MPTITEFLEARIAEDEAAARHRDMVSFGAERRKLANEALRNPHDPARVLAECEAKRAIIKQHEEWPVLVEQDPSFEQDPSDPQSVTFGMSRKIMWLTEREYAKRFGIEPPTAPMIRTLAAVYADHPDYQQEWKS